MAKRKTTFRDEINIAQAQKKRAARIDEQLQENLRIDKKLAIESVIKDIRLGQTSQSKKTSLFLSTFLDAEESRIIKQIEQLYDQRNTAGATLIQNYYSLILETYKSAEDKNVGYIKNVSIPTLENIIKDLKSIDDAILPATAVTPIINIATSALSSLKLQTNVLTKLSSAVTGRVGKTLLGMGKGVVSSFAEGAAQQSFLFASLKRGFEIFQSTAPKTDKISSEYQRLQQEQKFRQLQLHRLSLTQAQKQKKEIAKASPTFTGLLSPSGERIFKTSAEEDGKYDYTTEKLSTTPTDMSRAQSARRISTQQVSSENLENTKSTTTRVEGVRDILLTHTKLLEKIAETLSGSLRLQERYLSQTDVSTEEQEFETQSTNTITATSPSTATAIKEKDSESFLEKLIPALAGSLGGSLVISLLTAMASRIGTIAPLLLGIATAAYGANKAQDQIDAAGKKASDQVLAAGGTKEDAEAANQKAIQEEASRVREKAELQRSLMTATAATIRKTPDILEQVGKNRATRMRTTGTTSVGSTPTQLNLARTAQRVTRVPTGTLDQFGKPIFREVAEEITQNKPTIPSYADEVADDIAKNWKNFGTRIKPLTDLSRRAAGPLQLLFAGAEFTGRQNEGQTATQAAIGTAANVGGGMLGSSIGAALGTVLAGTAVVATAPAWLTGALVLGGAAGLGYAGSILASRYADKATGADKVTGDTTPRNKTPLSSSPANTIAELIDSGPEFTTVKMADGRIVKRQGARSSRNNNPGNVKYTDFTISKGAIGKDLDNFAVFPTMEMGLQAHKDLLGTSKYKNATIRETISSYAPPSENNTEAYIKRVVDAIGGNVTESTKLNELTEAQREKLSNTIIAVEGSSKVSETVLPTRPSPTLTTTPTPTPPSTTMPKGDTTQQSRLQIPLNLSTPPSPSASSDTTIASGTTNYNTVINNVNNSGSNDNMIPSVLWTTLYGGVTPVKMG